MTHNSERLIILSAVLLVMIIVTSTQLYQIEHAGVSIGSMTSRDLLDPELALEHGFNGYVNVSYVSETPRIIIVSPGKTLNYTIQLELIAHVPEFTEAIVVLDPENSCERGVGPGDLIFNDYIRYSPDGTILLKVDEPRNVTMILSVPEESPGTSGSPQDLLGVGIMADIPVAYEGGAHLDRIDSVVSSHPRDELVEKARYYIIEQVGEEYFDRYFSYLGFEECTTEDWRYRVGFFYNIQVGKYTEVSEVCFWYDSTLSLIRYTAVPSADNLMPFNVTREEAIDNAIEEAGSIGWVEVDAVIHYCDELSDGTPVDKYVWVVNLYLNPREAMIGSLLGVVIDLHSGTVIESERISWHSTP